MFWKLVSSHRPLIDTTQAKFDKWHEGESICVGMRQRQSLAKHGIVRRIGYNSGFEEATYLTGRKHGLSRMIVNNFVYI